MNLERREYERVLACEGDVEHADFLCVDFSEIGMRFNSPYELNRGECFSVDVMALSSEITLLCRVVWCRELMVADGHWRYQFGVTFDGYSMGKQLLLRELIDSRLGDREERQFA